MRETWNKRFFSFKIETDEKNPSLTSNGHLIDQLNRKNIAVTHQCCFDDDYLTREKITIKTYI